jgi:signal peptidase I
MDFALILFVALTVTGLVWAADRLALAPRRRQRAAGLTDDAARVVAQREPVLVEYARAFFPVILIVFLLRSFLVEPFRIPSGSMMPNLMAGDFILVNKFTYGIRLPVLNRKVMDVNELRRGEVVVFRFPGDQEGVTNYIKRVVGLPGDRIVYRNKQLIINDQPMPVSALDVYPYQEGGEIGLMAQRLRERLGEVEHDIQVLDSYPSGTMEFVVPAGHYFMMGDNRDRSNDSRYWGTVPDDHIVGKAFMIWFSWDVPNGGGVAWRRIGNSIQ